MTSYQNQIEAHKAKYKALEILREDKTLKAYEMRMKAKIVCIYLKNIEILDAARKSLDDLATAVSNFDKADRAQTQAIIDL